jgi:protein-S-isoprenylcysteine O-methyltransferase Ste14
VGSIATAARSFVYASAFVLLWWWVVSFARPLDSRIPLSLPDWARFPGLVIAGIGALVALWCIAAFTFVGRGTPAPFDAPREFVAVGPYRFVRNPMYLGGAAVLFGAGLVLRSAAAFAVTILFLLLAHGFVLAYEEPTLESRFGESYRRYKASVNRWIPRRRR